MRESTAVRRSLSLRDASTTLAPSRAAIFAVTNDPFIVYTSNIFAILGLRAMYFMLAGAVERFHLLKYGLAFILIFVAVSVVALYDRRLRRSVTGDNIRRL